jgi:hypothetical protein
VFGNFWQLNEAGERVKRACKGSIYANLRALPGQNNPVASSGIDYQSLRIIPLARPLWNDSKPVVFELPFRLH